MASKKQSGVIGGVFMAHAPQFFTLPESEDRKIVNRVKRLAKNNGKRLRQLRPDVYISISNDHANQFVLHCVPPFALHRGNIARGSFAGKKFEAKLDAYELVEERIAEEEDKFINFEAEVIERSSYLLAAWNGGNCKTQEDFERVAKSLEYIKEEVRKDESLQEVYDEKIKMLAGLEIPIESE